MDLPGQSQASRRLLSRDPSIEGFDISAGETWIYPTNYPTREYQFNIIQKALLKNTLVSLPTGLGKTFIAAVVMYNYYRWYPEGKMIFMAPTKPLVKQQVEACYNIMAIPEEATAELTGAKQSAARTDIWTEKRVFFITPQVLQNDLNRIEQLGPKIKCLVFDEAHKARGNHAYCEVIQRLLAQGHKNFRVLALSATPGSSVNDVLEVVRNLLISHLEFRTEESIDVQQYVFQRTLETVVVPLSDKLIEVREKYLNILEFYTRNLKNYNIIQGNFGSLTKGKIFMLLKDFQQRNRGAGSGNYSEISRTLNICVTLYHAFELLIRHGLRNFMSFFDEHMEKPLLKNNNQIRAIVEDIRRFLGPLPNIEKLPDGTYSEVPNDVQFGHPKYYKLRDILVKHFQTSDKNTRVIVFFEYRESVMEAHLLLLQSRPLLQPRIFLGQGSGITQKVQIGVVKAFREGRCNVLLSTCIGEEGLDVGEVDLIVCFDVSTKSPIRMVQRMGRTGRKRAGKVLILVTEGKEQQTLKDCLIQKNNISTFVLGSKQLSSGMYPQSPRLVPENITPRCEKIFITVKKKKSLLKKNGSIKDMLSSISSGSSDLVLSQDLPLSNKPERIKDHPMLFDKDGTFGIVPTEKSIFSKHIEKQRKLPKTHKIKHSKDSETLVKLLQFSDSKRFNLPTQLHTTQNNTKVLKQGDIRNMFLSSKSQEHFEPPKPSTTIDISTQEITKNFEKSENEEPPSEGYVGSVELFAQISNYIFLKTTNPRKICEHCPGDFNCDEFKIPIPESDILNNNWIPSEKIFEGITAADLKSFSKCLNPKNEDDKDVVMMDDESILNNVKFTQIDEQEEEQRKVQDEKSFRFEAPEGLNGILNKFGDSLFENNLDTQKKGVQECISKDSFATIVSEKELFDFFKIDDIFEPNNTTLTSSQETIIYSPQVTDLKTPAKLNDSFLYSSQNIDLKTPENPDDSIVYPSQNNDLKTPEKRDDSIVYSSQNNDLKTPERPDDSIVYSSQNNDPKTPEKPDDLDPDESMIVGGESPIISSGDRMKKIRRLLEKNKKLENPKELFDKKCSTPVTGTTSPYFGERNRRENGGEKHFKVQEKEIEDICDISSFFKAKPEEMNQKKEQTHQKASKYIRSKIVPLSERVDESLLDLLTSPVKEDCLTEVPNRSHEKNENSRDLFEDLIDESLLGLFSQPNKHKNSENIMNFDKSDTVEQNYANQNLREDGDLSEEDLFLETTQEVRKPKRNSEEDCFLNLLTKESPKKSNKELDYDSNFLDFGTQPATKLQERKYDEDFDVTFVDLATQPSTKITKQDSSQEFEISSTICDKNTTKRDTKLKQRKSLEDLDIRFIDLPSQSSTKLTKNNSSEDFATTAIICDKTNIDVNILNKDEAPEIATMDEIDSSEELFEDTISNLRKNHNENQEKQDENKINLDITFIDLPSQSSAKLTKNNSSEDFETTAIICDKTNIDVNILNKDKAPEIATMDEIVSSEELFEDTISNLRKNHNENQEKQDENKINNLSVTENQEIQFEDTWFSTQVPKNTTNQDHVVDLTMDSPPKSTPINSSSRTTQLCITQMINLINKTQSSSKTQSSTRNRPTANLFGSQSDEENSVIKCPIESPKALFSATQNRDIEPLMISTQKKIGNYKNSGYSNSQKENERSQTNRNSSGSDSNNSLVKVKKKSLLSTRRRFLDDTQDEDFKLPQKTVPKPPVDPYEFITQRKKPNQKINKTIEVTSSSDDEFEVGRPRKSPVFLKPRATSVLRRTERGDTKKKKVRHKENPFLDLEAELSEDEHVFVSSDEEDKHSDDLDDSFVVPNATQTLDSQMHAHYLKSVRSPAIGGGRFKILQMPQHNISNVFSQPVNDLEEDTYLQDSFCVDEEESQIQPKHDLSELEILEMKLTNMKKKRKPSEDNASSGHKTKRRRIILADSDSE